MNDHSSDHSNDQPPAAAAPSESFAGALRDRIAAHPFRTLPPDYALLSPAAEVAGLLKAQDRDNQLRAQQEAERARTDREKMAALAVVAYQIAGMVGRVQARMEETGLRREFKELRVLKDRLVGALNEAGLTWRDPLGETFEGDLPDLVEVIGWRLEPDLTESRVTQVTEPIILADGVPVRHGVVIVSGPEQGEAG